MACIYNLSNWEAEAGRSVAHHPGLCSLRPVLGMRPCLKQSKLPSGPVWLATVVIGALSKLQQEDSRSEVGLGHSVRSSVLVAFFPAVTKYQTKTSQEKKVFIVAHSLRTQSREAGLHHCRNRRNLVTLHLLPQAGSKDNSWCSAHFAFFLSQGPPCPQNDPTHIYGWSSHLN